MNFSSTEYGVLFFFCLTASSLCIPLLKKVAFRFRILDLPTQAHKTHTIAIPYLGGMSIVVPTLIVTLVLPLAYSSQEDYVLTAAAVVLPALFLSIVGLIDDIKNLPAFPRFISQLIASSIVSIFLSTLGFMVEISGNPIIDFLVSVFWMVGITNALNFIDNLDGGAAGIVAVASFTLFVLGVIGAQFLIAAFALAISGATLGFLWWNKNPASIYLGDSGALFLGMILSVLLLQYEPSAKSLVSSLLTPILIMAVPIIDTTFAVTRRLREGRSPFQGGRDHLSHVLIDAGLTRRSAAIILWGISSYFCVLATLCQFANERSAQILNLSSFMSTVLLFSFFLSLEKLPKNRIE